MPRHVLSRYEAVAAASLDLGERQRMLGEQATNGRAQKRAAFFRIGCGRCCRGGGRRGVRSGSRRFTRCCRIGRPYAGEHLSGEHLLVEIFEYLRQHSGGGRGNLDRDLVGLQFEQRLVFFDRVADRPAPSKDGRLGTLLVLRNEDIRETVRAHTAASADRAAAMPSTLGTTASSSTGL